MNQKQWIARQEELEREGKYDVDMNEEHRTFDALSIDEGYDYLLHTPIERVRRAVVLSVVAAVGPVITWFGLGARVKGRENLRALKGKGAICACTHTHHLDTLLIKNALGPFRTFHTGSYYLLKKRGARPHLQERRLSPRRHHARGYAQPAGGRRRIGEAGEDRQLLSRTRALAAL